MANLLGKSVAFISSVERGDKQPPSGFDDLVINAFGLEGTEKDDLRKAFSRARTSFEIRPTTEVGLDTASMLARRFNDLDELDIMRIREILDGKGE
ncbi:MAG: XRE family transcriptional regulator [Henriciella sp.]|nr:XRE family transcriptional regulator [Henriciella sp.]